MTKNWEKASWYKSFKACVPVETSCSVCCSCILRYDPLIPRVFMEIHTKGPGWLLISMYDYLQEWLMISCCICLLRHICIFLIPSVPTCGLYGNYIEQNLVIISGKERIIKTSTLKHLDSEQFWLPSYFYLGLPVFYSFRTIPTGSACWGHLLSRSKSTIARFEPGFQGQNANLFNHLAQRHKIEKNYFIKQLCPVLVSLFAFSLNTVLRKKTTLFVTFEPKKQEQQQPEIVK